MIVRGDVGLAVELQDQGDLASELLHVFLRQADVKHYARIPSLLGQPQLEAGVNRIRVGEKIHRTVLQPLVYGQKEQGAVGRTVLVQQPVQPYPLPQAYV